MSSAEKQAHIQKKNDALGKKREAHQAAQANSGTPSPSANGTVPSPTSAPSLAPSPSPPVQEEPGTLLRNLVSANRSARADGSDVMVIDGFQYRRCSVAKRIYHVRAVHDGEPSGSLVDGGCNGGLAGDDVLLIHTVPHQTVTVNGIAGTGFEDIPIGTVAAFVPTESGPIIGFFHQYATTGKGHTIHSPNQLRHFGNIVDDCPRSHGGSQRLQTHDGYCIPLSIRGGLPYMDMRKPTLDELDLYPHVDFTSDAEWLPEIMDDDIFYDAHESATYDFPSISGGEISAHPSKISKNLSSKDKKVAFTPKGFLGNEPDIQSLRKYLNWISPERVLTTLKNTTQWFRAKMQNRLKRHYKTRFPAANVPRLNEDVATDTFFSDVPAHDDGIPGHGGCTMVQIYVGIVSHLTQAYPMKSENQIVNTLRDFIRFWGAPNNLKSDNAKAIQGQAVLECLRQYLIGSKFSEPYQQNQNPAERRMQDLKADTSKCMDRTGTPAKFWLLCLLYLVYLYNHLSYASNQDKTPLEVATGVVPDISPLLAYHWWQPVYYLDDDGKFPSESKEKRGRWAGVAENIGDTLTYLIVSDETEKVVVRSVLRPVTEDDYNFRADPYFGNENASTQQPFQLHSLAKGNLPRFSVEELMQRTFLYDIQDGQKLRAQIIKKIEDEDAKNHQNIKFLCKIGDDYAEEILTYNEICQLCEEQDQQDVDNQFFTFQEILDHAGPYKKGDHDYKGSTYNVQVLWSNGEITWEPFDGIRRDDPISLATYAKDKDLLNKPGWKNLRRFIKTKKKYDRLVKQAVMKAKRRGPIWKFGVQVPRDHEEAMKLDTQNGDTKWADSEKLELSQLADYKTFLDKGIGYNPGTEYTKIRVRFVYDVKHDGRRKSRMVAGGHLTPDDKEMSYSGVVSLRSIRLALLIGELNGLSPMVGDVGNAYLEAYTKEKVYFIAGPEFGELAGHTLIISKALYGLRTSGARYHEVMAGTLRDMGFKPTMADPDLWYRDMGSHYDYVCVYVDDLMIVSKHPQEFFDLLINKYKYILKGVGPPEYHLGGNFGRDPDGTLYLSAEKYVAKLMDGYQRMFESLPNKYGSPLTEGDSPELDTSDLLDADGIRLYQSMIGALQWCVSLARFDIQAAVMSLSSFRAAPRVGHLERAKHIYGYLRKHNRCGIRFRTGLPDMSGIEPMPEHNWMHSVYGDECKEEIPDWLPPPKGKLVRTVTFVDANLMHCKVTGKSATGVFHLVNQTPIEAYSKKQATVETATYGSEFVAARTATEQIMDLRFTLRSMGVPIEDKAWMLGDNRSVITSSTIPFSLLSKRHNALAYHRVRAAIAGKYLNFCYIPSKQNVADILTKHLGGLELDKHVRHILKVRGETAKAGT